MKKTVAIFGGSQEKTYINVGKKYGYNVLFHNGKARNGGNKREFRNIIKKADCIVVLLGACGHVSMEHVKDLSKKLNKKVIYQNGFGASGAFKMCEELFQNQTAA